MPCEALASQGLFFEAAGDGVFSADKRAGIRQHGGRRVSIPELQNSEHAQLMRTIRQVSAVAQPPEQTDAG
jgi:hypothetical protein